MDNRIADRPIGEHDWHSREYVNQWIERDVTRDNERRPLLQQMLELAPFAHEAEIRALDIGAGYGLVTEQVLRTFPNAHVTLQDYSEPMFEQARTRLRPLQKRISYIKSDLRHDDWSSRLDGTFDLVVSGLAIHNLRESSLMQACYRSIRRLLSSGGMFLDYDLFGLVAGGAATHEEWMREAGFEGTQRTWEEPPLGIIAAWTTSVSL